MGHSPSPNNSLRPTWRATVYNAFIGLIITPVLLFGSVAISALARTIVGVDPFDMIAAAVVFLALLALWCWLTSASLRDACTHAPCWPVGVAIGYAASGMILGTIFWWHERSWVPFAILLGYGLVQGVSAYRGVVAGNRAALLGAKREGVGRTCAHCHYDLSASAEGLVCPECGGVMRYERGPTPAAPRRP